ncbi:hypothetical protein [Streptomyces sp. NPDC058297]|uniref:hypothetical protein n=1 Tax=Streptomyces sp. NPDC058297 TaxID=3346433 RepID=UPI0036E014EA
MRQWPVPPTERHAGIWFCSWCYAATHVGGEGFEIARLPYLPMEMRWERAVAHGPPPAVAHAFGIYSDLMAQGEDLGVSRSDLRFRLWPAACPRGATASTAPGMIVRCRRRFVATLVRNLTKVPAAVFRSHAAKDAEMLALRHENAGDLTGEAQLPEQSAGRVAVIASVEVDVHLVRK